MKLCVTNGEQGVAKGNEPESIYAVMSGTHYNGQYVCLCAPPLKPGLVQHI